MVLRNPNADESIKDYDELQPDEINDIITSIKIETSSVTPLKNWGGTFTVTKSLGVITIAAYLIPSTNSADRSVGTVLGILPVGFRPKRTMLCAVFTESNANPVFLGHEFCISTNGEIRILIATNGLARQFNVSGA